jgi:hypothetical protein
MYWALFCRAHAKKGAAEVRRALSLIRLNVPCYALAGMAVIVFPIVLDTPFVRFHVPPLVVLVPAIFAGFAQLVTRMLGLLAVPTVVLDRFVNVVIGPFRAMLAFRFIRANIRRARQKQKACESR